jgi:D-alanyl-D-alanine carboxypeptidase
MRRSIRATLAALLMAAGLLALPATNPAPAAGADPLPACRIADILTVPRDYDSWATTFVDRILSVGPDYKPPDLVPVSRAGVTGGGSVRKFAIPDLTALATAARKAGVPLGTISTYRSYKTQIRLFNGYAKGYGFDEAITFSARPGHSEHQLGLTIDFAPSGVARFIGGDAAGRWMAANAWKYGWILSFPKGKIDVTCFSYEPWHFRYYGRELAKQIHDSGLTAREYLWQHFPPQVDLVTGQPFATPTPAASAPASGEPGSPGPGGAASGQPVSPIPSGPSPSTPPGTAAATWFGLDPVAVLAAVALVIAGVALLALRAGRPRARPRGIGPPRR